MRTLLILMALAGCAAPIEPVEACGSADLVLAPPPRDEPGVGTLVAADFRWVDVLAEIDAGAGDLRIEARASFQMSDQGGRPVFQLRSEDAVIELDGAEVEVETVVVSDPPRTLRVLPEGLSTCSEHILEVVHTTRSADVEPATLPRLHFDETGAWWSSAQEDGLPDQMLELWLPTNLLFDRFDLSLDVSVEGAAHGFEANGEVVDEGENQWTASFGDVQSHGPFWVVHPSDGVVSSMRTVALGSGDVDLHLFGFEDDAGVNLEESGDVAEAALRLYDERLGPYMHGGDYLAWMRSDLGVSMEYDGATLSQPGALGHEILHSWWGRGVAPVSDHHGWMDEGMAFWGTGSDPFAPSRVEAGVQGARLLSGEDAWSGAGLGLGEYLQGSLVFSGLAHVVGVEALLEEVRAFSSAVAPGPTDTEALERWLYCAFEEQYVLDVFQNKVRGLDGFAEPPPTGYCER
jgi:hypothetical protein